MKDRLLPVKILQIGMTRNLGGLETYLMQQFNHIDKEKVTYDFVNITSEHEIVFANKIRKAGAKIFDICSRHKNPLKHYWQWIKLLMREGNQYKALVLNTNSLEYVFPILIAKFFGIPIRVIHSHNSGFENKIGISRRLLISFNRYIMKWSTTDYFACSRLAGEWMFGKTIPFSVIHNAINIKNYSYDLKIRQEVRQKFFLNKSFVIGHIGRFSYQKNHEFLIDIFAAVYKRNPSARLLLIGDVVGDDSFLKKVKERVAFYHLDHVVKFLGMREDVPDLLQAIDCFVLPSHFEGLPLVGIEAQAVGLQCFFSDTITKELDITSNAHFISLNSTPEQWADEILKHSKSLRRDMSEEIRASGYDIEEEINKIIAFYTRDKNE